MTSVLPTSTAKVIGLRRLRLVRRSSAFGCRENAMHPKHPDLPQPPSRTVVGTGLIALDVVVPESPDAAPRMHAGGTCGNVLAALAYLEWTAYPVARLGDDGPMRRVCQDLTKWGVRLDFVLKELGGGTPMIA